MSAQRIPPSRTDDQRMNALNLANEIRGLRAKDKKLIKARKLDPRALLMSPTPHWESARVADLLRAVPAVGRTKVERMLKQHHISPSRTLAGMTDGPNGQRSRLCQAIDRYCEGEFQAEKE